jgi:serine/threonine protein phosphatase PrpC
VPTLCDGHGGSGEHCAQIASSIFPKKLEACRRDKRLELHGDRAMAVPMVGLALFTHVILQSLVDDTAWSTYTNLTPPGSERQSSPTDAEKTAYARAFTESNETVVRELGDGARSSGTTAVVAHIIGDMLHLGNVGDSRAILGINAAGGAGSGVGAAGAAWEVVEVTHDQTCFRNDERERMRKQAKEPVMFATLGMILGEVAMSDDFGEETIEAADDPPRVFRNGESYPGCAFTRSFGDTIGKQLGVTADPELLTYQLDSSVRALVIASDGVFEFMENEEVLAIAEKHWGNPHAACEEIVAASYNYWATEDTRSDDVTCMVVYLTPKKGAVDAAAAGAAGLPQGSEAKSNWKKLQTTIRAGAVKNRPALRFANAVLAKVAIDLRRRRGSVAMEELFPDFDWQVVSELKRLASLKGGLNLNELKLNDE